VSKTHGHHTDDTLESIGGVGEGDRLQSNNEISVESDLRSTMYFAIVELLLCSGCSRIRAVEQKINKINKILPRLSFHRLTFLVVIPG